MSRAIIAALLLCIAACASGENDPTLLPPLPIQVLDYWQPTRGALAGSGQVQPWQFIGRAGDVVLARATADSAAITLTLQTPDGSMSSSGIGELAATLPVDGVYTLLITATGAANYILELVYTDRPNPAAITPTPLPPTLTPIPSPTVPYDPALGQFLGAIVSDQPAENTLAAPQDRHVYTFTGRAGQFAAIQLERTSDGVDPVVRLYAPSGLELASDDNSGGDQIARLFNVRLPENGDYTVQVWGDGFTGGYRLDMSLDETAIPVTPSRAPSPTLAFTPPFVPLTPAVVQSGHHLSDHIPVSGTIEETGDFSRFTIATVAGDTLTIAAWIDPGSTLRPLVEVYDPVGALVATGRLDFATDIAQVRQLAVSGGTYQVFVSGANQTTGAYTLSYGQGSTYAEIPRGIAPADEIVNGQIEHGGIRDSWLLDLRAGDVVTAIIDASLRLSLVAPNGTVVAESETGTLEQAAAPLDGRYRLRVQAAAPAAYTITWTLVHPAPTFTPLPGTILLLSFDDVMPPDNAYQYYTFQGQAGQVVRIQVVAQPGSGFDPVAALLAPDGSIIAESDDTNGDLNPRFTMQLPVDGSYRVRVNGYNVAGRFTLTVEALLP